MIVSKIKNMLKFNGKYKWLKLITKILLLVLCILSINSFFNSSKTADGCLKIGTAEFIYNAGGNGIPSLGTGWSMPESKGVWSDGRLSTLNFCLEKDSTLPKNIQISVTQFLTENHKELRVRALLNDVLVSTRTFDAYTPMWNISIPSDIEFSSNVSLVFEIENPISPKQLGLSTVDSRELGLGLLSIKFGGFPQKD